MNKFQGPSKQMPQNYPMQHYQTRRAPKFCWNLVLIPLVCAIMAWILNHIKPAISWRDILDLLDVHDGRYSKLAILGLVLISVVLVKRTLDRNR